MEIIEILRVTNNRVVPATEMIAKVEEMISNANKKPGEEGFSWCGYGTDAFGYCLLRQFETGSKSGKTLPVAVELISIRIKPEDGNCIEVTYHSIGTGKTIWENQIVTLDYLKENLYKFADFYGHKIIPIQEEKKMTAQEIAKELYKMDWVAIQTDSQPENEQLRQIGLELQKYTKKQVAQILLAVLEARTLNLQFEKEGKENPFKDMPEFLYIFDSFNFYTDKEINDQMQKAIKAISREMYKAKSIPELLKAFDERSKTDTKDSETLRLIKQVIKEKYFAIPEEERRFCCGDPDTKDLAVRELLDIK